MWCRQGSAIPLGQVVLLLRDHLDDSVKQAALAHLANPSHDEGSSTTDGDVCLRNNDGESPRPICAAVL